MALPVPPTLSPSKVSSFTDCALAFRFSAIDRLPEPPSVRRRQGHARAPRPRAAVLPRPAERTRRRRRSACLDEAAEVLRDDPEYAGLELDDRREARSWPTPSAWSAATSSSRTPRTIHAHRPRAQARGRGRRGARCAASSTGSSSTPTASCRHRLQDRARPRPSATSRASSAASTSTPPVRAVFGRRPAARPAAVPRRAGGHHRRPHRPVDPGPRTPGRRHLDGGRAGLRARRLPAQARAACATGARSRRGARRSAATPRPRSTPLAVAAEPSSRRAAPLAPADAVAAERCPHRRPSPGLVRAAATSEAVDEPSTASLRAAARVVASRSSSSFDDAVDARFDRLRGNPVVDRVMLRGHRARRLRPAVAPARVDPGPALRRRRRPTPCGSSVVLGGRVGPRERRASSRCSADRRCPRRAPPPPADPAHHQLPERPRQRRLHGRRAARPTAEPAGRAALVRPGRGRGHQPGPRAASTTPPTSSAAPSSGWSSAGVRPAGLAPATRPRRSSVRGILAPSTAVGRTHDPPSPSPGTIAAPSPATPTSTCSTGWPPAPTGT